MQLLNRERDKSLHLLHLVSEGGSVVGHWVLTAASPPSSTAIGDLVAARMGWWLNVLWRRHFDVK